MALEHTQQGFDQLIGLDITSAGADEVRATLVVTPELLQPYGLLHGGVLCSIVETLGSVGGAAAPPSSRSTIRASPSS